MQESFGVIKGDLRQVHSDTEPGLYRAESSKADAGGIDLRGYTSEVLKGTF